MGVKSLLLIVMVALAGCSDPPDAPVDEGGEVVDEPLPEPVVRYERREVFNETLGFANNGQGSNDALDVTLEAGSRNATVQVWRRVECPLTTYADPVLVIESPGGQATTVPVFETGQTEVCPFVDPADELIHAQTWSAGEGAWSLRTEGDCGCIVRVAVSADVPL